MGKIVLLIQSPQRERTYFDYRWRECIVVWNDAEEKKKPNNTGSRHLLASLHGLDLPNEECHDMQQARDVDGLHSAFDDVSFLISGDDAIGKRVLRRRDVIAHCRQPWLSLSWMNAGIITGIIGSCDHDNFAPRGQPRYQKETNKHDCKERIDPKSDFFSPLASSTATTTPTTMMTAVSEEPRKKKSPDDNNGDKFLHSAPIHVWVQWPNGARPQRHALRRLFAIPDVPYAPSLYGWYTSSPSAPLTLPVLPPDFQALSIDHIAPQCSTLFRSSKQVLMSTIPDVLVVSTPWVYGPPYAYAFDPRYSFG